MSRERKSLRTGSYMIDSKVIFSYDTAIEFSYGKKSEIIVNNYVAIVSTNRPPGIRQTNIG